MAKKKTTTKSSQKRATKSTRSASFAPQTNSKSKRGKSKQSVSKVTKKQQPSGLDLAATELAKSKEPLTCKAIAEKAISAGWQTKGKTPHATLYSAMIREIEKKGKGARFKKVGRGQFTATAIATAKAKA